MPFYQAPPCSSSCLLAPLKRRGRGRRHCFLITNTWRDLCTYSGASQHEELGCNRSWGRKRSTPRIDIQRSLCKAAGPESPDWVSGVIANCASNHGHRFSSTLNSSSCTRATANLIIVCPTIFTSRIPTCASVESSSMKEHTLEMNGERRMVILHKCWDGWCWAESTREKVTQTCRTVIHLILLPRIPRISDFLMSMWEYDEYGNPYPPDEEPEYGYQSHHNHDHDAGSSRDYRGSAHDYHGSHGHAHHSSYQSDHSDHSHHGHSHGTRSSYGEGTTQVLLVFSLRLFLCQRRFSCKFELLLPFLHTWVTKPMFSLCNGAHTQSVMKLELFVLHYCKILNHRWYNHLTVSISEFGELEVYSLQYVCMEARLNVA